MWGCSSSGRALRSQRRGSEFDPRQLHHNLKVVVVQTQPLGIVQKPLSYNLATTHHKQA